MSHQPELEIRASRAICAIRDAFEASNKYNDFGSVLGAQDEVTDIYETLMKDLGHAATRARRLKLRIDLWEKGEREAPLLSPHP